VKKPGRDLPIGIVGTLIIASTLYVAVSLVVTGMIKYTDLDKDAPLSQAFFTAGLPWAGFIVAAGSVTTMTATTLVSLIGQPRIFYQMAKDGLLWQIFATTNKSGIPIWGTIITGIMSGLIAFSLDLDKLANMISIGTLLAFIVVCGGVVVLRGKDPERPTKLPLLLVLFFIASVIWGVNFMYIPQLQPWSFIITGLLVVATFIPIAMQKATDIPKTFACPFVPYVPCLGIFMNVWFICSLPWDAIVRLVVWTVVGMAIYLFYGIRHSVLYVSQGKLIN